MLIFKKKETKSPIGNLNKEFIESLDNYEYLEKSYEEDLKKSREEGIDS